MAEMRVEADGRLAHAARGDVPAWGAHHFAGSTINQITHELVNPGTNYSCGYNYRRLTLG
jgi:hypothetical protein